MEPTLDNRIGEPTIKKIEVSSQECVGDPGKESNALWVIVRGAHKKPTYAQMVKASNRVVSEVSKNVSNRVISEVSILSSTGNRSHTRKIRT